MKKGPSDKFICRERHGLLTVIVGIISPEKRNIAVPIGEDMVIAEGDPVGILPEVLKNTFGATEGRFAIDNPLLFIELFPEDIEVAWFFEMRGIVGEYKSTTFEAIFEEIKELTHEQRQHDPYGEEESLTA